MNSESPGSALSPAQPSPAQRLRYHALDEAVRARCPKFRTFATYCLMTAGALLPLALWSITQFGSVENAVLYLNGHRFRFGPAQIVERNAGSGLGIINVPVTNLSKSELIIAGANSNCRCVQPLGIPMTIAARDSAIVNIQFQIPESKRWQVVTCYVDCGVDRHVIDVELEIE